MCRSQPGQETGGSFSISANCVGGRAQNQASGASWASGWRWGCRGWQGPGHTGPCSKDKKLEIHLVFARSTLSFFYQPWLSRSSLGTSLVVQWVRLRAPNAGGLGVIPGQGTRSHVLQLGVCILQVKMLHAATKTWNSSINNIKVNIKKVKIELKCLSAMNLLTPPGASWGKSVGSESGRSGFKLWLCHLQFGWPWPRGRHLRMVGCSSITLG